MKNLGGLAVTGMIVALAYKVNELSKKCSEKDKTIDELTKELAQTEERREIWLHKYVHEKSKNLFGSKKES